MEVRLYVTPGKGLLIKKFVEYFPPPGISCLANHVSLKIVGQLIRAPVDDCPLNHEDYNLYWLKSRCSLN